MYLYNCNFDRLEQVKETKEMQKKKKRKEMHVEFNSKDQLCAFYRPT